jgi:CO dehydrogenase maturation factor
MRVAVSGKGGVGKTTVAGTLARLLGQRRRQVLALDADSNPNLAIPLGIPREQAATVTPVPRELAEWREDPSGRAFVHLTTPLPSVIEDYGLPAPDNVRLLVMGTVDHAGVGCRCSAHAAARGITAQLTAEADTAVLDMEAGLEHLGRGTVEHIDTLLVVTEPYFRALEAASRIRDLAAQLGLESVLTVANRVRSDLEREAVEQYCRNHALELAAVIPYDEAVLEAELLGLAPIDHAPDSPAMLAVRVLAESLER